MFGFRGSFLKTANICKYLILLIMA